MYALVCLIAALLAYDHQACFRGLEPRSLPTCGSGCSVTSFVSWSLPCVDATRWVVMAEAAVGALEAAAAEVVTVEAAMEVAVKAAVMDPLGRANHNKVQLHLL